MNLTEWRMRALERPLDRRLWYMVRYSDKGTRTVLRKHLARMKKMKHREIKEILDQETPLSELTDGSENIEEAVA